MNKRKPKSKVKVIPVDKEIFFKVLKIKNSSIRKLGLEKNFPSEKTIRRLLNERGGLRPIYIEQIARLLDVDSRLLTGEMFCSLPGKDFAVRKIYYRSTLNHIDEFPYFKEEQDKIRAERAEETLKRILSLFDISYSQFEKKDFEAQYEFQHDLLDALETIMYKHFDCDGYGNTDSFRFSRALYDLENYHDNHYERLYAETTLRPHYKKNPPKGYNAKSIQKLSSDDLLALDMSLHMDPDTADDDYLEKKYSHIRKEYENGSLHPQ